MLHLASSAETRGRTLCIGSGRREGYVGVVARNVTDVTGDQKDESGLRIVQYAREQMQFE